MAVVVQDVRRLAQSADLDDIDSWWTKVVDSLVALIAAGWAACRELAEIFLPEHAAIEGREVSPVLAEWSTERVLNSLHATGPAAFKTSVAAGKTPTAARASMTNQLAGSSERLVMAGERETVEATIDESEDIVGWRRVGDGDPCSWCAMLISRGAVYKTAESAGQVVGRAGRTRGNQAMGEGYHDMDGCTVEPLYESEEEPDEVGELYDQWSEVTAGKGGRDALNAWRQYWEGREDDAPTASRSSPPERATPTSDRATASRGRDERSQSETLRRERAETIGNLAVLVDEAVSNGLDLDGAQQMVDTLAERLLEQHPDRGDIEDMVIEMRRMAAESDDAQSLVDELWKLVGRQGAMRIGDVGDVLAYDEDLHELADGDRANDVRVLYPGVRHADGSVLQRAVVSPVVPTFDERVDTAIQGPAARASVPLSLMRPYPARHPNAMTDDEREALAYYKGPGYRPFNDYLRAPTPVRNTVVGSAVADMDGAMRRSPLPSDIMVLRGIGDPRKIFRNFDPTKVNLAGAEWIEHAPVSTTSDPRIANDFASYMSDSVLPTIMRVLVPAGVHAIELSGEEYESELLLERGLRMRVVSDSGPDAYPRYVDVEVIL